MNGYKASLQSLREFLEHLKGKEAFSSNCYSALLPK